MDFYNPNVLVYNSWKCKYHKIHQFFNMAKYYILPHKTICAKMQNLAKSAKISIFYYKPPKKTIKNLLCERETIQSRGNLHIAKYTYLLTWDLLYL